MIRYFYKNSDILFIGINPHFGSAARRVPFSNNKMFWYLLSEAHIIPETRTELRDDAVLKNLYQNKFASNYHLGLVNIVDRPSRNISDLKKGEEEPGRKRLARIIKNYKPKIVCFVGKITYQKFTGKKNFDYGWQMPEIQSLMYVMHTPLRGLASIRVKELKIIKQKLSELKPRVKK